MFKYYNINKSEQDTDALATKLPSTTFQSFDGTF